MYRTCEHYTSGLMCIILFIISANDIVFMAELESTEPTGQGGLLHSSSSSSSHETRQEEKQEPAAEEGQELQPATDDGHQMENEAKESQPAALEMLNPAESAGELRDAGSPEITYMPYESELELPHIMRLMKADLSEPYSIYTYRYFIHNWPSLCFLAMCEGKYVGAIVCKMDNYSEQSGYIAMLAVDKAYRKRKIGSTLVKMTIKQMASEGCHEVVLETEVTNRAALALYENLGFVRDRYLHQYYLNGVDAYRLKLWLRTPSE